MIALHRFSTVDCVHLRRCDEIIDSRMLSSIWMKNGKVIRDIELNKIYLNCKTGEYYGYFTTGDEAYFWKKLCLILSDKLTYFQKGFFSTREQFLSVRRRLGFEEFDISEENNNEC